jgi:hypothetical protein
MVNPRTVGSRRTLLLGINIYPAEIEAVLHAIPFSSLTDWTAVSVSLDGLVALV